VLTGHTDLVCSVAARGCGVVVASGARDKSIRIWDLSSGGCTATLLGSEDMICGLAFHPAAERRDWLLSGEKSGAARLWSLEQATVLCVYKEHTAPVWSVAFGVRVGVSASHDMKAKVWPLPDMLEDNALGVAVGAARTSKGTMVHPSWVFSVSVASGGPAGELAATGCGDRMVRLWSLRRRECLRSFTHGSGMTVHPVLSVCMRKPNAVTCLALHHKTRTHTHDFA